MDQRKAGAGRIAVSLLACLLGGVRNAARIDPTMLPSDQIALIGGLEVVDSIEDRGATDFFGHNYFVSNPRVSADMIALLRYGLLPNEPSRPLEHIAGPFWRVPTESFPSASTATSMQ